MFKQTFETSATPHVQITVCTGDLVVSSGAPNQVVVRLEGEADDVTIEREGERLTLAIESDCRIICPPESTLTVESAHGDLVVKGIHASLAIGNVRGDLTLRDVGPAELQEVRGDLRVRRVDGALRAATVGGGARISDAAGPVALQQVGGDLRASGLAGGLTAEGVGGGARLGPPFVPGMTYHVKSGGDLKVTIPEDASLRLDLTTGGTVRSSVPGLELEEEDGRTTGTLGDGAATLEAQVGGKVRLRPENGDATPGAFDFSVDLNGIEVDIHTRLSEAMAEMESRLQESLSRIDGEAIRQRVEKDVEQVRQRAEREAERARLRAERAQRRWLRVSGQRPTPSGGGPSDEERLRVLRMVEEGKITPDQAAELLAALEGH